MIKIFSGDILTSLVHEAISNTRRRQHLNIHESYREPCQRLFNAIEPSSYIRPHRHLTDPKNELLVALRGKMALVTFDNDGEILNVIHFGSELYGKELSVGVEVSSDIWHTVLALEHGSVLLEVKQGPFDLSQPKDFAPWAPEEGSPLAGTYFATLLAKIRSICPVKS